MTQQGGNGAYLYVYFAQAQIVVVGCRARVSRRPARRMQRLRHAVDLIGIVDECAQR
jgi:hypothetical protein